VHFVWQCLSFVWRVTFVSCRQVGWLVLRKTPVVGSARSLAVPQAAEKLRRELELSC
jgi:hypothetical protein